MGPNSCPTSFGATPCHCTSKAPPKHPLARGWGGGAPPKGVPMVVMVAMGGPSGGPWPTVPPHAPLGPWFSMGHTCTHLHPLAPLNFNQKVVQSGFHGSASGASPPPCPPMPHLPCPNVGARHGTSALTGDCITHELFGLPVLFTVDQEQSQSCPISNAG